MRAKLKRDFGKELELLRKVAPRFGYRPDAMAVKILSLEAERDRLAEENERLRDLKRTCECGEDEQCMFARERDEARAEAERLKAEMKTMLTPCQHAKLMAEASDPTLREQVKELRGLVHDTLLDHKESNDCGGAKASPEDCMWCEEARAALAKTDPEGGE